MNYPLIAALATNVMTIIGGLWVAAKWAEARADVTELEQANEGLRKAVVQMQPDAQEGQRARLQRSKALMAAKAANAARKAAAA